MHRPFRMTERQGCNEDWVDGWCVVQVWPICGDGLTMQITHTRAGQGAPETLMMRQVQPDPRDKPHRQKASPVPGTCTFCVVLKTLHLMSAVQ